MTVGWVDAARAGHYESHHHQQGRAGQRGQRRHQHFVLGCRGHDCSRHYHDRCRLPWLLWCLVQEPLPPNLGLKIFSSPFHPSSFCFLFLN